MAHEILSLLVCSTFAFNVAIAVVLLLRKPTRVIFGARAAYLLWMLVPAMSLAVCLPAASEPVGVLPAIAVSAQTAAAGWLQTEAARETTMSSWILAFWVSGSTILAIALLFQQRRFVRSLGTLRRSANGWSSEANLGPALVGALWPRVVLPADFHVRYSAHERNLILAHEGVHLARGDAQINALVALLRCFNWFSPLAHVALSRFRFDQEIACDAAVISRFPEARRCYADAMLKTQLAGQARQELRLPVGCYWQSDHPLKERIMLLKKPIPTLARRALATMSIVALISAGSVAAWATQPGVPGAGGGAPKTSIQLGELQNIAPSENISYRRMRPPKYPVEAIKAHMGAKVLLKVLVGEDGVPKSAEVEKIELVPPPTPRGDVDVAAINQVFADSAIAAAKSWVYNPGLKDSQPSAGYAYVPIHYFLSEDDCGKDSECKDLPAAKSQQ